MSRKILIAFFTLVFSMVGMTVSAEPFTDFELYAENFDAVQYVKDEGLFEGYFDGSFGAQSFINRAEFSKVLVLASGVADDDVEDCAYSVFMEENDFVDVDRDIWYGKYVYCARQQGWISGDDDIDGDGFTTFRPAYSVSIAEAAKMLILSQRGSTEDAAEGNEWYEVYMNYLADENIMYEKITQFYDEDIYYDSVFFEYTNQRLSFDGVGYGIIRPYVAELLYRLSFEEFNVHHSLDELVDMGYLTYDLGVDGLFIDNTRYNFWLNDIDMIDFDVSDIRIRIANEKGAPNDFVTYWHLELPVGDDYYSMFAVGIYDIEYHDELEVESAELGFPLFDVTFEDLYTNDISCAQDTADETFEFFVTNCNNIQNILSSRA